MKTKLQILHKQKVDDGSWITSIQTTIDFRGNLNEQDLDSLRKVLGSYWSLKHFIDGLKFAYGRWIADKVHIEDNVKLRGRKNLVATYLKMFVKTVSDAKRLLTNWDKEKELLKQGLFLNRPFSETTLWRIKKQLESISLGH